MSAHTPGPWKTRGVGIYGSGVQIAEACSMKQRPGSTLQADQAAANARLIAAAPDLLAALTIEDVDQIAEAIENFVMGPVEGTELNGIWQPYLDKLNALRAAILKATGR
jgi:hypothetical protein